MNGGGPSVSALSPLALPVLGVVLSRCTSPTPCLSLGDTGDSPVRARTSTVDPPHPDIGLLPPESRLPRGRLGPPCVLGLSPRVFLPALGLGSLRAASSENR
uniref:Secreted protein n=1 Tax=Knipowitschia caucasica TaxID=637954 RepID=A0AAV2LPP9_KNICA